MASTKTRTKTIRLANESADFYEKVPLNRVAESVHRLLEEKKLIFDGEEIKIPSDMSVHTENGPIPAWRGDLNSMLGLGGMSFEEFMEIIYGWVCDGTIDLTDGVGLKEPSWVTDFRDACHDLCIPVDKAVESACKALRKGII